MASAAFQPRRSAQIPTSNPIKTARSKRKCSSCRGVFDTTEGLRSHQMSTGHCFCRTCNLIFSNSAQHVEHIRVKPHSDRYECCDCHREYTDQKTLTTHCCVCDSIHPTKGSLAQHSKNPSKVHISLARQMGIPLNSSYRCYQCHRCNRRFQAEETLTKHMSIHKRVLRCPAGDKCKRWFASASAILNHLESGMCRAGMDRLKLNQLVIQHDQDHLITNTDAAKAIELAQPEIDSALSLGMSTLSLTHDDPTDCDSRAAVLTPGSSPSINPESHPYPSSYSVPASDFGDDESDGGVLLTPSTGSIPSEWLSLSPQIRPVDDRDLDIYQNDRHTPLKETFPFASKGLRCPLCPPDSPGSFNNILAFQMHLNSPTHAPKIFHCPTAFVVPDESLDSGVSLRKQKKKEKTFATLSGLASHMEAGACQGGVGMFRNVIKYVEERLGLLGCGGVKLLVPSKVGSGEK